MSKIDYVQLDAVKTALEAVLIDGKEIEKVLNLLAQETVKVDETTPPEEAISTTTETDSGDETPKVKNQFVVVISDPNQTISSDLVGWVLQMPEDDDISTVLDSIKKGAYNFNASRKGNKYPVKSIGEALNAVPSKFFKPYAVKVKTKEPIYVVVTDNVLPKN